MGYIQEMVQLLVTILVVFLIRLEVGWDEIESFPIQGIVLQKIQKNIYILFMFLF